MDGTRVVYKTEKMKGFVLSSIDGKITDGSQTSASQPNTSSSRPWKKIAHLLFLAMVGCDSNWDTFILKSIYSQEEEKKKAIHLSVDNKLSHELNVVRTWCPSMEEAGWLLFVCKSAALNYLEETIQSGLLFAITIVHLVPVKTAGRQAVKWWLFF